MRTCDNCGKKMDMGYCVFSSEYYCSEDCLHSAYSPQEYKELYEEDNAYWTQWEDGE